MIFMMLMAKPTQNPVIEEKEMFYAIQTTPAKEQETKVMIENLIAKDLYTRCFILTRDMRKKFGGQWITVKEKLFPGYIFVETDMVLELYLSARKVPMLTKFLGREDEAVIALNEKESKWMSKLIAAGEEVPVSEIDIEEGNKVQIQTDPLAALEGYVKKIDLHKRRAEVEVEFMGEKRVFYLGIEFVRKV